jgi:hypothetical protein
VQPVPIQRIPAPQPVQPRDEAPPPQRSTGGGFKPGGGFAERGGFDNGDCFRGKGNNSDDSRVWTCSRVARTPGYQRQRLTRATACGIKDPIFANEQLRAIIRR